MSKRGRPTIIFTDVTSPDLLVVLYATFGMSNKFIGADTGFSNGQIGYRLRAAGGINRWQFRDGKSPMAQKMLATLGDLAPAATRRKIGKVAEKEHGEVLAAARTGRPWKKKQYR